MTTFLQSRSLLRLHRSFRQATLLLGKAACLGAACVLASSASAQTVQIDPAGAGGFELGATFAANGWTVQNGSQTNKWLCSTGATGYSGARCAYISKNTTANSYTLTAISTVHMYRDVSFPATETAITFTANCKQKGEDGWDRLLVYISNGTPSGTPAAGTPASNSTTLAGYTLLGIFPVNAAWTNYAIPISAAQAGNATVTTSRRILFTWQNDGSGGTQTPAAVDDISLSSDVAAPPGPCLSASYGQYPTGATTPACSGIPEDVSSGCGYAGEYSKVKLTAGENYTFTSSNSNDWITISNNAGTVAYAYGTGPINFTAPATANCRFYTHTDGSCGEEGVCRTRYVQCGTPANMPCLNAGNGQYPAGAITPSCSGVPVDVAAGCGYAGEYTVLNLTSGVNYIFTSSIATDWITVSNGAGTVGYVYGTGPVNYTPNSTTTYRFYTHTNSACGEASVCRNRFVQCGVPLPPPVNNDCSSPTGLTVGVNGSCPTGATAGTTAGATGGAAPYPSCIIPGLVDVWYSFNSGSNTSIEYSVVLGTQSSIAIQVLTACGGSEVTCQPDLLSGSFPVAPNTNYVFRVLAIVGYTGTFTICLQAPPAPVCNGGYTAPANGSSTCNDGSTATLSWPSVTDAGAYDVYFDNAAGTTLVSADQTSTTYTTSALGDGTYSWRIVPKNGSGGPAGPCPTWTFTRSTPPTWYADADADGGPDGYGDPAVFVVQCTAPPGYVANNTDNCPTLYGLIGDVCDDGNPITINDVITGSCVCAGTLPAGCMDPLAENYDANAAVDDGSCTFCAPTITYNTPIPTPILIGSGIPADNAAVSVDCHPFTVGITAYERYVGAIVPAGNVYTTTVGHSPVSGSNPTPDPVLARWNLLGSVDLGSYDFTQVNVFLDLDFDPGAVPVWNTLDLSQAMITNNLGDQHVYQASENLASPFWAVAFPSVTFDPNVPGTYDIRVRLESPTSNTELLSMSIQVVVEAVTYYSQASGNVTGPIWDKVPVGTPGPAYFGAGATMVVQNGNTVTNTADVDVKDVTVETGGTLVLNASTNFKSHGNGDFSGTLTANDNSTLSFLSTGTVVVTSNNVLDLFNLTANVPGDLHTAADLHIRGTLQLEDGDFDAGFGHVTMISTASGTGRLGPVVGGASYTGSMTVQRYIPAGHTNWRALGSPVAGRTVDNWQDDFITAGYPGSQYPNFDQPTGSGILWPSIRSYEEANPSADANDGIVGVTSNTQPLTVGKGFFAWSGDNFSTTAAFTVDVTGEPTIAYSPIMLPMNYTDTGASGADGWNLVSNPLISAIDFEAIDRGSDVGDQYWIFNPVSGTHQTYSNGVGQGAVNGVIQSSQGFWLKADGADYGTTVSETAKVNDLVGGVFGGSEQAVRPILRLTVASAINTYSDEATFVFDQGTPELDAEDAPKFTFRTIGAPLVAGQAPDGRKLAIDFFGAYTSAITIPVTVDVEVTGTYTVSAGITGMNNLSCLTLEDLQTGTITPLTDGTSYSFAINADDDANAPRFLLHGTAPLPLYAEDATCANSPNGTGTVVVGDNGPVDITWTDASGNILLTQNGVPDGVAIYNEMGAGNYTVHVSPIGVCGVVAADFTIDAPPAIVGSMTASTITSCPNTADGSVSVEAIGGTGELGYIWNDGTVGTTFNGTAGAHQVTITDANNCSITETYTVPAGEGAIASFTNTQAVEGQPVAFTNTSTSSTSWTWDFGDGDTSTGMNPVHTYTEAGTYTVTLTASDGNCTDIITQTITVDISTAVTPVEGSGTLNVYATQQQLVIDHPFGNAPVDITVFDATGRQVMNRDGVVKPERITLSDRDLNTAVWFVRVKSGDIERTFRVPLIR